MSTKYLFAAIQAKTQDPIAKVILIYLADSANQEGQCWPAHSTIAEMCETSVKTVKRKLDDLCAMGFVDWDNRSSKGFKSSNKYQLCEPEVMLINGLDIDSERRKKGEAKIGQPVHKIGHSDLTDRSQGAIEPITEPITTLLKGRPTVEQVEEYVKTREIKINANKFVDHYSAIGWKVGRNDMKDWKAAVRTWEAREKQYSKANGSGTSTKHTSLADDLSDTSWA